MGRIHEVSALFIGLDHYALLLFFRSEKNPKSNVLYTWIHLSPWWMLFRTRIDIYRFWWIFFYIFTYFV